MPNGMKGQAFYTAAGVMRDMIRQPYLRDGYAGFDIELNCVGWFPTKDLEVADDAWILVQLPMPTDDDPLRNARGYLAAAIAFEIETIPGTIDHLRKDGFDRMRLEVEVNALHRAEAHLGLLSSGWDGYGTSRSPRSEVAHAA